MDKVAAPIWVLEDGLIKELLHFCLGKFDQGRVKVRLKVSPKTTPQLFDFNHCDTAHLWQLICILANEYSIFDIKLDRKWVSVEYENALLTFRNSQQFLVRSWLNRPAEIAYAQAWRDALDIYKDAFEDTNLLSQPLKTPSLTANQLLHGLSLVGKQLRAPNTARALSAKCFNGDSKILDKKEDLIRSVFPSASKNVLSRPVLTQVYVTQAFDSVLFVENLDTFLLLIKEYRNVSVLSGIALVYSAGFKASAARIRDMDCSECAFVRPTSLEHTAQFYRWWIKEDEEKMQFFWGDFDYAAMSILRSLRTSFNELKAWEPGYAAILRYHEEGYGHPPNMADKSNQIDPGATGCHFSDEILLPTMRASNRFLDQELISVNDLSWIDHFHFR